MTKPLVLVAPYPRTMGEIFDPTDLSRLRPFAEVGWGRDEPLDTNDLDECLDQAWAVVGYEPPLRSERLEQASSLRAIVEVGGHFPQTIDYAECFRRSIHVLSCAPAFAAQVAELALAMTFGACRSMVAAHMDDPCRISFAELSAWLLEVIKDLVVIPAVGRRWRVPVVYGGSFGEDLNAVASVHGLTTKEVVARHTACEYRVYMLGFMPGFTYLGGLDPILATPRRTEPRLTTPSGTISIGGVQAAIQCLTAPSGWHLLGRTPVRTFDPRREPMFLLRPGDRINFFSVDAGEWDALDHEAEAGKLVAECLPS